ncbi:MAG: hypothetical protein IJH61_09160 [Eubacteriaceae bacterium]|nr:hypothetical protein [Eubacteriaceae bacterium]
MQFLIKAYDGPDRLDRRMAARPDHLSGMRALGKRVVFAGGLLDDAGNMKGSALVMDFPDRAALDAYLEKEPYVTAGVWETIDIEPVNAVLVRGEAFESEG